MKIQKDQQMGIGECALFRGLSHDDRPDYETVLQRLCIEINKSPSDLLKDLIDYPSIQFGLEQALLSLKQRNKFELFPSEFTQGKANISINGLIWMGDKDFMKKQIIEKLKDGFTTIKLKIGAIDFQTELNLIKLIRKEFNPDEIEIRVDANGAFLPHEALDKMKRLAEFNLHSIEQPIQQGQIESMAKLCRDTPLPIALDEELIGVVDYDLKEQLIDIIKPQYIILKPSLVGGFKGSREWITIAEKYNIQWWITSALESNIGLNAIAQYTYKLKPTLPQGLGTGGLFNNNIEAPLEVVKGSLRYNTQLNWGELPC